MNDRSEILATLTEFLRQDTDIQIENVDESLSLREGLGLDSVDLVGIIMRVEGHYRIRMTHLELENVGTVRELIDLICAKIEAGPTVPLPTPANVPANTSA